MSSSQNGGREPGPRSSRVIKSGSDVGARFAFPALEQVTPRDLPPSLSAPDFVEPEPPSPPPRVAPAPVVSHHSEAAATAEARARAMERRAAAVLAEAEEAAARRQAEAAEQAHAALAEAEAAVEMVRSEARERGLAEGREEGRQAGLTAAQAEAETLLATARAEADALLAEAQSAAVSIRQGALEERERLLAGSQDQILDLAFAMARQVLKAEVTLNRTAVLPMLEAALAKLKGEEEPQIRVSPEVQALLEEHRSRLLAAIPGARRLSVEGDPGLTGGDFLIQGAQGFVDGRLDRQLQVLESDVKEEER